MEILNIDTGEVTDRQIDMDIPGGIVELAENEQVVMPTPAVEKRVALMTDLVESIEKDKVIVTSYNNFSNLQSWDDIVQEAANMREGADGMRWCMGDLVNFACGPKRKAGRPTEGKAEYTVAALAFAIGENRSILSRLAANSEFWKPREREKLPPNVSWRQCARARTLSGWKPGVPIEPDQKKEAMAVVYSFADGTFVEPEKSKKIVLAIRYVASMLKAGKSCLEEWEHEMGEAGKLLNSVMSDLADIVAMLE